MVQQENQNHHFLVVTYPAQGHINPSLEFAKRLTRTGVRVTFVTTLHGHRNMMNTSTSEVGLAFAPFSDGYDEGFKRDGPESIVRYMTVLRCLGSEALSGLIENFAKDGRPITCLIYSLLLTWATDVAHKLQIPSALLWIQPATVFDIYYYYFNDYKDFILNNIEDSSNSVKLPGLPPLQGPDLPSFIHPSNTYAFASKMFEEQFESLSKEPKSFPILVNTFDELEMEALKAVGLNLIGVGPLIPPAFLNANSNSPSDKSVECTEDSIQWLDLKDKSSVVYVSFGSSVVLSNDQMAELARGLVDSGRPFLWVIRSGKHGSKQQVQDNDENEKYSEILREEHKGMIVPWCSQVKVLNHPSIGCFVTHCGWSSTLETLTMGVPVVAFPQWTDQGTNAKLMEDVWKIGVRVRPNEDDKIVMSEEIIRCLEEVMDGPTSIDLSISANKWKCLAREAVRDGGISDVNLRAFVNEVATLSL